VGKRLSPGERAKRILDKADRDGIRLEEATARKMVKELKDYRSRLAERVASAGGFQARRLADLQAAVDRLTDRLEEELAKDLVGGLKAGWRIGTTAGTSAGSALGVSIGGFGLTADLVSSMQALAAERILDMSDDLRSRVNNSIMRGVLGEKSPFEVVAMIRDDIGGPDDKGQALWRAERIARTEVGRVQSAAQQGRFATIDRRAPGTMGKVWINSKDARVRDSHREAGRRYRVGGDPGPIPVGESFIVGGAALRYPLDPNGPPDEVIECRCRHRIVPLVAAGT
jgi:hypothetical protein